MDLLKIIITALDVGFIIIIAGFTLALNEQNSDEYMGYIIMLLLYFANIICIWL